MHPLFQDCRYAARMLRKNLGLSIVVVLSLAIGIGANSAIFSVVDALLLRPLPYPEPKRLANIWLRSPATGINRDWLSQWQYTRIRDENRSFDETAVARLIGWSLTGREGPERLRGIRCSSSLFRMIGARPYIGRLLLPDEDRPEAPQVAILSYGLWQRLFSGDPKVLGKSIVLENNTYTVVGVVSPEFRLSTEVLPALGPIDDRMHLVVRTSTDPAGLTDAIRNEIRAVEPVTVIYNVRTMEERLHDSLARQRFSTVMLGAFAAFALLLAAVGVYGVMSYLVAQSTHDIGVRIALGARAGDIAGLVVRQGMTLGGIGIAGGFIGAALVTRVMASLLFGVSAHDAVTFSAVAVILAMVAFAATVIPATRAMRVDPMVALREE
jgi:hypothetical protein